MTFSILIIQVLHFFILKFTMETYNMTYHWMVSVHDESSGPRRNGQVIEEPLANTYSIAIDGGVKQWIRTGDKNCDDDDKNSIKIS